MGSEPKAKDKAKHNCSGRDSPKYMNPVAETNRSRKTDISPFAPDLQGCYIQGNTYEEALENIRDAISLHAEDRLDSGEEVPQPESVSLTYLEVAV
jgi:predicted RNase H-like HicB family nuclease